jgi:hypothetical protein
VASGGGGNFEMEVIMTLRSLASAALLLTAACATSLPQAPTAGKSEQVPAPEILAGNAWRYSVRDGFTKLPRGTVEYRVSAVAGDTVTVEVRNDGQESTELYARDGNWLKRPATNMQTFTYSPAYRAFDFPLAAGKTWKSRLTATDPADGRSFPVTIEGVVLGWEKVRVPAGEFDALKVRRTVFLDYWQMNERGQSVIEEIEWYAPAAKQAVRRETTSKYLSYIYSARPSGFLRVKGGRDDGSSPRYVQDDWLIYELVSHSSR